jgi:glycosyltransferase involved in cell wall biosynthesis
MNILHLSYTDFEGGAARAASRLNAALNQNTINSSLKVRIKKTQSATVIGPASKIQRGLNLIRPTLGLAINRLQRFDNRNLHSGNWLPSNWSSYINKSSADIVNLHWIAGETMSIEDIGRITKPIVWTMHDMWPFTGMEHITTYDDGAGWRHGYKNTFNNLFHNGFNLNRLVWKRKLRAYRNSYKIVAPSTWLSGLAAESALFSQSQVTVIPNALDTNIFKPLNSFFAKEALNIPIDKKVILFGAAGGSRDPNKGFRYLESALEYLWEHLDDRKNYLCLVFGGNSTSNGIKFEQRWLGQVWDDYTLALIYSAADVMVVPSRQENLPQSATEAMSCGCPVVAFNNSGLPDVVEHLKTGYLAKPFDSQDLAVGIKMLLLNNKLRAAYGFASRQKATDKWSFERVAQQYIEIYEEILS